MEILYYGSTPHGEECAQVGTEGYACKARRECSVFIEQLTRILIEKFGEIPFGLTLKTKGEQHDFGTYYEVVAVFYENDRLALDVAYWLDNNIPENWDDVARTQLAQCK